MSNLVKFCDEIFSKKSFSSGINSWQHPVLILRDVPFDDLHSILEFIYMGEVNVVRTNITSFLKTAELLQIQGLAKYGQKDKEDKGDKEIQGEVSVPKNTLSDETRGQTSVPVPAVSSVSSGGADFSLFSLEEQEIYFSDKERGENTSIELDENVLRNDDFDDYSSEESEEERKKFTKNK